MDEAERHHLDERVQHALENAAPPTGFSIAWRRPIPPEWPAVWLDALDKLMRDYDRQRVDVDAYEKATDELYALHDRVSEHGEDHRPLLTAVTAELAEHFGVATSELRRWQVSHREFFEACKVARGLVSERVERDLYNRSIAHKRVVTKSVRHNGELVIVKYEEDAPGDVSAVKIFSDERSRWFRAPPGSGRHPLVEFFDQFDDKIMRPKDPPVEANRGPENPEAKQNEE